MQLYSLTLFRKSKDLPEITVGSVVTVKNGSHSHTDEKPKAFRIVSVERPGILKTATEDFGKLRESLRVPFYGGLSRRKFHATMLVYLVLSVSGIGALFVRGWRLKVMKNMQPGSQRGVGPDISSFTKIGEMISLGMKLVLGRLLFMIPDFLILAAWGYTWMTAIASWLLFWYDKSFGDTEDTYQSMLEGTGEEFLYSLIASLFVMLLVSYLIKPVYKIHEVKYAAGKISFRGFFNYAQIKDSFKIYKASSRSTLEKYIWSQMLTLVSFLVGLALFVSFPPLWFLHPIYKFYYSHWPKAYAFGLQGKRLSENGLI